MLEINSMLRPVIMDQHGQLYIFEDQSELEEWKKSATELQMVDVLEFECLNTFRDYINRLKQALTDIESMADDARRV